MNWFHEVTAIGVTVAFLIVPGLAYGQHGLDVPGPTEKQVRYSPYPAETYPNQVLFGDTHLHTSYSTDAGLVGAILGPEEAYRFARGEEVTSNHGLPVKLKRPLDFLVVADHAENLGLAPLIAVSDPTVLANPWGKTVHDLVKSGKAPQAFNEWLKRMQALDDPFKGDDKMAKTAWARILEAAEKYNSKLSNRLKNFKILQES